MKRKIKSDVIIIVMSVWATASFGYALKFWGDSRILSNSILSVIVCLGVGILLNRTRGMWNKRLYICAGITGILFSGMLVAGTEIYLGMFYSVWENAFAIFGLTPVFASIAAYIMCYYESTLESVRRSTVETFLNRRIEKLSGRIKHPFAVVWGAVFVCWIPGLLATFPGIYAYDSIFQVKWFMMGEISGHHPILHTYWLGSCFAVGEKLFGSYEIGMLLYSLTQMLVMSLIFAYIICYIGKKLPKVIQGIVLALYAFLPYNALFSFSATKDVVFAGVFAILVIKSYEIAEDMESFFSDWKRMCSYVGWIFLMCVFRNNGYYAFLCLVPVLLVICRHYWKKVLLISISAILCWNLYAGPVYNLLGIKKGASAEMLSVPMQQLAYVMCTDPSELTEKEKALIKEYIPDYHLYGAGVSDPVKDNFNSKRFDENPAEFIKLWLRAGMKYPGLYVTAFLRLNMGFWYPDMIYPDPEAWCPYIEYVNSELEGDWILVERTSFIPPLSKFYEKFAYETVHQKIPVLSMLFQPGAAFWLIVFGIMYCIYKKRYEMAIPFGLMVGLWLTLMLSPVVLLRYAYPLIVSLPVVLCMGVRKNNMKFKGNEERKERDE